MAQRLFNLSKWIPLEEGECLHFANPKQRMVNLEVNCADEVTFFIVQAREDLEEDPERKIDEAAGRSLRRIASQSGVKLDAPPAGRTVTFLALAKGRDRLEFGVEGEFDLCIKGGSASVYTIDGEDIATHILAPVIFTKIANRRARNPQLELMQYTMRMNSERMYQALETESSRRIEAMERRLEAYAPERNPGTSLIKPRAKPPVEAGGPPAPEPPLAKAGKATPEGGGGGAANKPRKKAAGPDDDQGTFGEAV